MSYTPPVSKGGFAYANDSFFAEASNQQRHRRATLPELQSLFHPSTSAARAAAAEKEPVGHWYEAQLLHYGLTPSKTKAVAKTRLLDAVNKGALSVPEHIRKLEVELKKEWLKNERVAKKAAKDQKAGSDKKAKEGELSRGKDATKGKRKRDEDGGMNGVAFNTNQSLNSGANGPSGGDSVSPKRTKQTARRSGTNLAVSGSEREAPRPKQTARYSGPPRGAASIRGRANPTSGRSRGTVGTKHEVSTPQRLQTTRCSRGSNRGRGRGASTSGRVKHETDSEDEVKTPRRLQTARRSRPFDPFNPGPGRGASTSGRVKHETDSEDEGKEESSSTEEALGIRRYRVHHNSYGGLEDDSDDDSEDDCEDDSSEDDNEINEDQDLRELEPLGLINGMYAVQSTALNDWPDMFDSEDFSLVLCLEGNTVWGAYDFGMHTGIIHLSNRPWNSSFDEVPLSWRGRENGEGEMSFGSSNHGWIQFLGGGRIEGMINCYGEARFSGQRVSARHDTKAPRDARSMRSEWEGYNQREYDRENRARWGGSGW